MSQYSAEVPNDGSVRPEIKTYFEKFYAISDSSGAHEEYAKYFTKNGKLIMGPNEVSGQDSTFFGSSSIPAELTAAALFLDSVLSEY